MNEWSIYIALYCVLLYTQSALQSCGVGGGGLSSTTTSVQHPLWCDGSHRTTAPVRSPHTRYRWRGERVIEPVKCMRSPHTRYRWRGERDRASQVHGDYTEVMIDKGQWWEFGQDTGVTPLLFTCHGIFNNHRESGLRFNVSSERRCFWQCSVPVTILGR